MLICRESLLCGGCTAEEELRNCLSIFAWIYGEYKEAWNHAQPSSHAETQESKMEGAVVGPARIQLEMADCHNVLVYFHVVCVYVAFFFEKMCVCATAEVCVWSCVCMWCGFIQFSSTLSNYGNVLSLWPSLGTCSRWQSLSWGSL